MINTIKILYYTIIVINFRWCRWGLSLQWLRMSNTLLSLRQRKLIKLIDMYNIVFVFIKINHNLLIIGLNFISTFQLKLF